MKTKHLIYKLSYLLFLGAFVGLTTACEDDEIGTIDRFELSLSNVPDTVGWGMEIPLKIIAANAERLEVTLTEEGFPGEPVYEETIEVEPGKLIYNIGIDVPADGSWEGFYVVDIVAYSGGATSSETKTLYIKEGDRELYLVGGSSSVGWNPAGGLPLTRHEKEEDGEIVIYHDIFIYLTVDGDGFKVLPSTTKDWEGAIGLSDGTLTAEDEADNFKVEEDGFYRVRFIEDNEASLGFSQYEIVKSNWGIIGSATPGGWDDDTDMTGPTSKGDYKWTIDINLLPGEFKFRENDAWDVNVGGPMDNLTFDGSNYTLDAGGNYTITLDLNPAGYTFSIE